MKINSWTRYRYWKKSNERLTREAEIFLFSKLETDREKVLDELVSLFVPIVHSLLKSYTWSNVSYDDLLMSGIEGIISAADSFDISKDYRFGTLATHYCLGRIRRVVDLTNTTIRKPSHINRLIMKINRLEYVDEKTLKSLVTDRDSYEQITNANIARNLRMEEIEEAKNVTVNDAYKIFTDANIEQYFSVLNDKEKLALTYKFGLFGNDEHTYPQLDTILKCDSEKVVHRAYKKIRDSFHELN
jgi:DNA-directed RNA polymerase sigma subunit (sigma70/sigma32)